MATLIEKKQTNSFPPNYLRVPLMICSLLVFDCLHHSLNSWTAGTRTDGIWDSCNHHLIKVRYNRAAGLVREKKITVKYVTNILNAASYQRWAICRTILLCYRNGVKPFCNCLPFIISTVSDSWSCRLCCILWRLAYSTPRRLVK